MRNVYFIIIPYKYCHYYSEPHIMLILSSLLCDFIFLSEIKSVSVVFSVFLGDFGCWWRSAGHRSGLVNDFPLGVVGVSSINQLIIGVVGIIDLDQLVVGVVGVLGIDNLLISVVGIIGLHQLVVGVVRIVHIHNLLIAH